MSTNHDLHTWLSSKAAAAVSWLSAGLGLGTFLGVVNTVVGIMSACWLTISIWNYFSHTRKKNRMELEELRRRIESFGGTSK